jgi:hypothetical protein
MPETQVSLLLGLLGIIEEDILLLMKRTDEMEPLITPSTYSGPGRAEIQLSYFDLQYLGYPGLDYAHPASRFPLLGAYFMLVKPNWSSIYVIRNQLPSIATTLQRLFTRSHKTGSKTMTNAIL